MSDSDQAIVSWIEDNVGGTVTSINRQPRWRPVWWVSVEHDGEIRELCVRGERTDMEMVMPLRHEMVLQEVMWEHGIPVPKIHGWINHPAAYVMDKVPGRNDFTGVDDATRAAVVDDYVAILARLHSLDIAPFRAAGVRGPADPRDSGRFGMARYEELYRAAKRHPEPFVEFCLGWLRRYPPDSKGRQSAIVWDSGQFHHADGRIVAVLDVEIGHLGDPMMDLAAWRMRDTVLGFGNFDQLYARYAELRGEPVDMSAIQRHHFAFTLSNQLPFGAALREPPVDSDLMTNLQWCCETNLFATEALAEILDVELPTVDLPAPRESRGEVVLQHLVANLGRISADDDYLRYQLRTMFRMARHAQRIDEIGDAVSNDDLDDLHRLIGHRPGSWREGEAELERFVLADADTGLHDEALLALFHRRNL